MATAFEFRARPMGDVIAAVTTFDAGVTAALLSRWGSAVGAAPRTVTSFLTLVAGPGGKLLAQAATVHAGGGTEAAREALAPVLSAGPVLRNRILVTPYHRLLPARHAQQIARGTSP
ncbi:hypothetical protein [Streptomyces sp. NBC_00670]|uniref:hypothetical protein n=1 Tax=Streptomyces sp. NBC_00670 TaxID=2975804 RepID=UPI002E319DDD|nr:hypothetical protein [Streptomyces sp. NBC_00670]